MTISLSHFLLGKLLSQLEQAIKKNLFAQLVLLQPSWQRRIAPEDLSRLSAHGAKAIKQKEKR